MKRLYRHRERGIFMGVCAGLGDYCEVQPGIVRLFAVLGLLIAFWTTLFAYLVAGLLLKERPLAYRGRRRETDFWAKGGA